MIYNNPVSSCGIRRPRPIPESTILDNVCHNSETTILPSVGLRNILETDRPYMKSGSAHVCGATEEKQQCLKIVTQSSSTEQHCRGVLRNSLCDNTNYFMYGFVQQPSSRPTYDTRLYSTASLDNFTATPEKLINQIQQLPGCHVNQRQTHSDKPVKHRLELSRVFSNFSWTIGKLLLALFLLVDLSSAVRGQELIATDIDTVEPSPCLLHFPTTTLVYTRHGYNCSIFYLCYAFKQWEMICSQSNTVFSLKHRVCVWRNSKLDDCQNNSVDNEGAYFQHQALPNNIDDTNNKQFQFSMHKPLDTKVDNIYAILTRQPLKQQNGEIPQTDILTSLPDKMVNFYDELKKDIVQKPVIQGMEQEHFNSKLQIQQKPESWYIFPISDSQTLNKRVYDLPITDSTRDFIKEGQSLMSFDNTKTTAPISLKDGYIVADSGIGVNGYNKDNDDGEVPFDNGKPIIQNIRQDEMPGEVTDVYWGEIQDVDPNAIKDVLPGEIGDKLPNEIYNVLSDEIRDVLTGEIRDVLSGETENMLPGDIKDVLLSEIDKVLPRQIKDLLPDEIDSVLPREIKDVSTGETENIMSGEIKHDIPSARIDDTSDKTESSSLDEPADDHKDSVEVSIEHRREKTVSPQYSTSDNVDTSRDLYTDSSQTDFTPGGLTSNNENVDKTNDSVEAEEIMKSNENTIFLATNDIDNANLKPTVTVNTILQNKFPQMQFPVDPFLEATDTDIIPEVQYVAMEILPRLHPSLTNETERSFPMGGEHTYLNRSTNLKSVVVRESKVRPELDTYVPGRSWLDMSEAQHVHFSRVDVPAQELVDNNYAKHKQYGNFVYQNMKQENIIIREVKTPSTKEYFQNKVIPNWNNFENPELKLRIPIYEKDNKESTEKPIVTLNQPFGEESPGNGYDHQSGNLYNQHMNVSKVVTKYNRSQKYGEPKRHEFEAAMIPAKSNLVVRPWMGLSNKLRNPPNKYKLFNYDKGIYQGKYVHDPLLANFVWPRQPLNLHTKTTKLGGSDPTIKKQIQSISDKIHNITAKISNIFWLKPQSVTPTSNNRKYVKAVNHTKISPKQKKGNLKSPMWYLKSRYINKPLQRHTDKFERRLHNNGRLGLAPTKPRQHKIKSRRMRITPKQKNNTKITKRLQIKKPRRQNNHVQRSRNVIKRRQHNNKFIQDVKFISGRHNKDSQDVRFIRGRSDQDVKFNPSRNNLEYSKEARYIPGRNDNVKRKNANFNHIKQVATFDDDSSNLSHNQGKILPKYYQTYLQDKLHRLLQHLQHPSVGVQKKDINGNHRPLKETKHMQPSKQTGPKISSSGKLLAKSSLQLRQRKNSEPTFSQTLLPHSGLIFDQNTKLGNLYSGSNVNSQNINEKRSSHLRILPVDKSGDDDTKKYLHSEQERQANKNTGEKNAKDDLYLGNIMDASLMNTDHQEHGRHILGKARNKTSFKLEDLKIDSLPKLFLDTGIDLQDWEKSRGFSYKIQPRPNLSLPGQTTAKTMSVFPPSTNPSSQPPTTVTTTMTTATTAASMAVFPTNLLDTTTANTTTTTSGIPTQPSDFAIPDYRMELKDRCGVMATPLIIGGRKSRAGQWPWQVSLQIVSSTTPWHRCGGVLVHARWVLTAAHCVEGSFYGDIVNWRVVMADYDLDSVSGNEIYRSIKRVISHPEYVRSSNFPNDVALLELDSPVDLTSGEVQTACLPDKDFLLTPGTKCWISGWGETRGSGGKENVMNEVPVDVMSHDQCKPMWGRVDIDVLDTQVCLGYGDTGACYGDSGGPLMCEREGRFYVAGVMSWLINNCSANNFPNVFTRLPNYMDWLYKELDYFEWFRHL